MLPKEEWLPAAQALPVGGKARVGHSCGDGQCMIVSHEIAALKAWCFRCADGGAQSKAESLEEKLARLLKGQTADAAARTSSLPLPAEFDMEAWPANAVAWLFKAGLLSREIKKHGFYYNERIDRVVMPVYRGEDVAFWVARGFDPERPKYLTPSGSDRHGLVFEVGSGPLVLVEDMLSAVKVGRVAKCWALLGTSLDSSVLARIANEEQRCLVWLDPDHPGQRAAHKILVALRSAGIPACNVQSARDPKFLSKQSIEQLLEGTVYA